MENPQTLARAHALRQDAWLRATRSQMRREGRHEYKVIQARKEAAAERQRAAAERHKYSAVAIEASPSGIAACIAKYESGGNPTAQNPNSSASGLYQFVDGTWGNYKGYSRAMYAPVSVQTERFYQVWDGGRGASQWVVSPRCLN